MLEADDFQKISLQSKIKHLQKHGTYIAERHFMRYQVWLYHYNGFFLEVWRTLSFGDIYSIDVAPDRSVKEAYLNVIDLKKLGLDL